MSWIILGLFVFFASLPLLVVTSDLIDTLRLSKAFHYRWSKSDDWMMIFWVVVLMCAWSTWLGSVLILFMRVVNVCLGRV